MDPSNWALNLGAPAARQHDHPNDETYVKKALFRFPIYLKALVSTAPHTGRQAAGAPNDYLLLLFQSQVHSTIDIEGCHCFNQFFA
jgi:hypothetical protein